MKQQTCGAAMLVALQTQAGGWLQCLHKRRVPAVDLQCEVSGMNTIFPKINVQLSTQLNIGTNPNPVAKDNFQCLYSCEACAVHRENRPDLNSLQERLMRCFPRQYGCSDLKTWAPELKAWRSALYTRCSHSQNCPGLLQHAAFSQWPYLDTRCRWIYS